MDYGLQVSPSPSPDLKGDKTEGGLGPTIGEYNWIINKRSRSIQFYSRKENNNPDSYSQYVTLVKFASNNEFNKKVQLSITRIPLTKLNRL